MVFTRNNLDKAMSSYLQQHKDNPVWWQEWSRDVLTHAARENKVLFVSIGYSACHWCHVMAAGSFQHQGVADFLNQHFVAVKVDREQRPDIDRYSMAVITDRGGQGGWPLNCFFTPDLRPIFALTYAPAESTPHMTGLLEILERVKDYYDQNAGAIEPFFVSVQDPGVCREDELVEGLWKAFDTRAGGFGTEMKFPLHCPVLFSLYYIEVNRDEKLRMIVEKTMDAMLLRGLHDHLQGGFFRYCVDREWSVPHFEKMLYDQAMLLWTYSLAFKVFQKEAYRKTVFKLIYCLEETFENDNLFYAGHDADTDHQEGATYLWTEAELRQALTPFDFERLCHVYDISTEGNVEGKNHLLKKREVFIEDIDAVLLSRRRKRAQPFVDKKVITSWNSLAGIGFVHAFRCFQERTFLDKARGIFTSLWKRHFRRGHLAHSSLGGVLQSGDFLQDYAAMLLLATFLYEETGYFKSEMKELYRKVLSFRTEDGWIESNNDDFMMVPSEQSDHPGPSSGGLATLGMYRADILLGGPCSLTTYRDPLNNGFFNIAALLANGLFHVFRTPHPMTWSNLPNNVMQVGNHRYMDCYRGVNKEWASFLMIG